VRILILTQYYPPEIGAPQRRLSSLARCLQAVGHSVRVLTAVPNYPEGRVHQGYRRRLLVREEREGVPVRRAWMWPTRSRSVLLRLASYLSFTATALVAGLLDRQPTDVVLTESPPLFLGATGWLIARAKGAAFVLNVADLWPRAAVEMKVVTSRPLIAAASLLERRLYRAAALVTTQTEGMRQAIESAGARRTLLFENGVDLDMFRPDAADPETLRALGLDNQLVVGYAGLHGQSQQLEVLIAAARELGERSGVAFALFGSGPEKEGLVQQARDLPAVRFFGPRPADQIPALVASCGAGVVTLRDLPALEWGRPSKLFEVMGSGVPVVLAARGESARIVSEADCGLVVAPGDAHALAQAVATLRDDPALRARLGANGRRYAEAHLDRARIAEKIAQALAELQLEGRS
jgi:glycosyltransferase involved in cell wall biosynthesis